jgi:hypothetical protein
MAIYSRIKTPYNLKKQYRINNGTVWDKKADLKFWLRTTEALNTFVDESNPGFVITETGTGILESKNGPKTRFKFASLNFNTKYITVAGGYDADSGSTKSIIYSGWIYLNSSPNLNNDGFPILRAGASDGYAIYVDSLNRLSVRLQENPIGGTVNSTEQRTTAAAVTEGKWIHFVVCIDSGASNASNFSTRVRIFINGQKRAVSVGTERGTPGGISTVSASSSTILGYGQAEDEDGLIFLDGKLADIALFQPTGDVTDAQAVALYIASVDGANNLSSGFLTTSPRNILKDSDLRRTVPANLSDISNDGRLGNHKIFFDDSRAIDITNPASTSYPSMLTTDHSLFSSVYNGHVDGQLSTTAASASFGIYDQYYSENNELQYKPFVESAVYNEHSASFYLTGTLDSVMPGFDQNLANKAIISFYGDVQEETVIGSTTDITAPENSSGAGGNWLKYYSFTTQQFSNVGSLRGVTTNADDADAGGDAEREGFLNNNALAFSPLGAQVVMGLPIIQGGLAERYKVCYDNTGSFSFPLSGSAGWISNLARPIDTFGFPGTDLYEASNDVTIKLTDKISGPFLLEKISVRFDFSSKFEDEDRMAIRQETTTVSGGGSVTNRPGNVGFEWINTEDGTASGNSYSISAKTITAFLLRQSAEKKGVYNYNTNIKSGYGSVKHSRTVSGSFRDVIGYGQSVMIQEANNFNSDINKYIKANDPSGAEIILNKEGLIQHGLGREQNILFPNITNSAAASSAEFSSTAEINFVPKNIYASPFRGQVKTLTPISGLGSNALGYIALEWNHDRSFLYDDRELVEERRYTNGINGTIPDTELPTVTLASGLNTFDIRDTFKTPPLNHEDYDKSAPYVLYPEDELILGIQGPISNEWGSGNYIKANYIKILPSKIQLTLYGSFLKEDKPTAISFAQNLNTNIIHDAIGPATVRDVFNISQRLQYTGSWSDDIMSGSDTPSGIYYGWNNDTQANTFLARRVGGRSSQGTQGEKGALKLYNRLVDKKERDYDSIMPSFVEMAKADTEKYSLGANYLDKLKVGDLQLGNFVSGTEYNHAWLYSFPFEKRFANIPRVDQFIDNSGHSIDRLRISIRDAAHNDSFFLSTNAGAAATLALIIPRNFGSFSTAIAIAEGVLPTEVRRVITHIVRRRRLKQRKIFCTIKYRSCRNSSWNSFHRGI